MRRVGRSIRLLGTRGGGTGKDGKKSNKKGSAHDRGRVWCQAPDHSPKAARGAHLPCLALNDRA
jgi:hypothetical protein